MEVFKTHTTSWKHPVFCRPANMFGLFTVCLALCSLAAARSNFPDFLMDKEESPNEVDSSVGRIITAPLDLGDLPCQMDVKITKRITGKCVRLAPGSEACVAGSYVHPFHHECLMER